ncbi:MAG TPA: DUF2510 domain-containing protein [Ilumatobacteraceae bacterium]|nr:DUF2510 domain-containing protein [Ilumatobacteraceae bacterium]
MANDGGVLPGWYADPLRRFELRYYNGSSWTADVSTDGDRFVDPLGLELPGHSSAGVSATNSPATNPATNTAANSATNSPATAAMVLGIIAVAISWLPFIVVLGVVAAVLALAFGTVGVRRSTPSGVGRSRAIAGLVTGASALVLAALGAVLTFVVLDVYDAYLDPGPNETTITSCEIVGSRAIASGTLENLGTDTADFSVLVGFVRSDTDNPHRAGRAVLDDVEPGETTEFQVERQVDLDEVDCIVIEVTGPLPFGLSLD